MMAKQERPAKGFSEDAAAFNFDMARPLESTPAYVRARVGDGGRLVIPSDIRKAMNLSTGDDVVMTVRNGVLEIVPQMQAVRQVQAQMALLKRAGVDEVDAFLAERRAESHAEDENEEANWWLKKGKTE